MIAVIADDLTGAAELGGLALRHNLVAEITTRINPASTADIFIVATDTRSMPREEAEMLIHRISIDLQLLKPALIFKKIDSVLRGHILAEIHVQQKIMNLKKALIVPGNPGLGRTVVNGSYLMNGQPVHLSSFSEDPEFPIRSSYVPDMLHSGESNIHMLKHHEPMPETGIVVGEVKEPADLTGWCRKIDESTLIAGAAEFFTAMLENMGIKPAPERTANSATLQLPALMICGSSFKKSYEFIGRMKKQGIPVSYIPEDIVKGTATDGGFYKEWIDKTILDLKEHGKAIIAMDQDIKEVTIDARGLRSIMAEAAAAVAGAVELNECLIEGGSTAAAVMRELGIETLYPLQELAPGVIRMGVKGNKNLHITLKPGSYAWPSAILHPESVKGTYEIDCSVH